jgi:hypothetical protein
MVLWFEKNRKIASDFRLEAMKGAQTIEKGAADDEDAFCGNHGTGIL